MTNKHEAVKFISVCYRRIKKVDNGLRWNALLFRSAAREGILGGYPGRSESRI